MSLLYPILVLSFSCYVLILTYMCKDVYIQLEYVKLFPYGYVPSVFALIMLFFSLVLKHINAGSSWNVDI